ncbi:MFS transporter [Bordetella bronchialis]|uniref:Multidrug MFS transporter n=1 Tax=Bordetella bronchialis TaxID=463025 RepID=A0A193G2E3_9BORD|nr:multidrug MFS transporter [Bordetella bronchialis]ANN73616.1 multidrug MFS transporter [Bordetella bronchialis]
MFLSFAVQKAYPFGAGMPVHERWAATLGLLLGVCMASLDTAIANTALPAIARDLQTSEARSIWVISSYQLAMVAALLPAATLGEIVGHRRIMVFGLVLFTLASLACGMAPSLEWLVAGRVAQGLGAAATMAVNGAMLRFIYPEKLLGRGVGLNSVMVAMAFAAGPTAASLVLTVATWHWLFLINVPVGLVAIYFCLRALPVTTRTRRRFDTLGAVLCAGFLSLLVFSLNEGAQLADAATLIATSVLCVVCLLLLLKRQAGHPAPFLAVDLLRRPVFALSAATGVCSFATQSLAFVSLPFMMQNILGYSQVETGFLITPWPVLVAVMAPIAGYLSDRMHVGILAGIGMAMLSVGMVLLATMPADPSVFAICWRLAVCGAGFGFFQSPNVRAIITAAPPERAGGASGMVGTVRLLGQSSGAALVAACFHASTERGAILALWLGAAFAAAAAVASVMRLRYRPRPGAPRA